MLETVAEFARGPVAAAFERFGTAQLVLLPAIGGLLVGPLVQRFAREAKGHGVPEVMTALAKRGGVIRKRVVSVKVIASSLTIGFGGTAGPFNGPIAAIFSMEVLIGRIRTDFLLVLPTSLSSCLVARYFLGDFPQVYGASFDAIESALWVRLPWELLLGLFVAALVANCATLGSGGSGGVFAPSLYMGAMLGGVFGSAAHALFPDWTGGSGAYAMVGMAAFFAATAKAPTTSIIILLEMRASRRSRSRPPARHPRSRACDGKRTSPHAERQVAGGGYCASSWMMIDSRTSWSVGSSMSPVGKSLASRMNETMST